MANFNKQEFIKYTTWSLVLFVIFALLLTIILNIFPAYKIYKSAKNIQNLTNELQVDLKNKDLKDSFEISKELNKQSRKLRDSISEIKIINFFPILNDNINSIDNLAEILFLGTNSFNEFYPVIEKNISLFDSNTKVISLPESEKIKLISSISDSKKALDSLSKNLDKIDSLVKQNKNNKNLFSPIKKIWLKIDENSSTIIKVKEYIPIIKVLPELLGAQKESKYLLLFQNNTELRATGGFIGTYGILKIKNGDIDDIFTDNIYNLDRSSVGRVNIPAPAPMKKYLLVNNLYLRDANWDPNYEETGKYLIDLYKKESLNQYPITGSIAMTPAVLQDIIGYFGEIKAMNLVFNKENVIDLLNYETKFGYWERQGITPSKRKIVIQKLSEVLFDKIKSLSFEEIKDIYWIVSKNLDQKQMLVYFENKDVQSFFSEKNWTGKMDDNQNSDYIAVVDSNMIAGKTDLFIDRSIDYNLKYIGEDLFATLNITYKYRYDDYMNNGIYQDDPSYLNYYRSYTRVYVPKGSWLESVKREDNEMRLKDVDFVKNDNNRDSFGFFVSIPKNEIATYTLEYKIPKDLADKFKNEYNLVYQKQAGILKNNLNINIDLGMGIKSYDLNSKNKDNLIFNSYNKKLNINGEAYSDKKINVKFYSEQDMSYLRQIIKSKYLSFEKEIPLGN